MYIPKMPCDMPDGDSSAELVAAICAELAKAKEWRVSFVRDAVFAGADARGHKVYLPSPHTRILISIRHKS